MDAAGNAASLTYSLNQHSGVVVPGTGMLLNNQMLLFDPWRGSANSVAGGKRPASSMMPSVVLGSDGAELALGASGSSRIPSALLQVMDRVFNDRLDLAAAVTAPRLHAEAHRLMADEELAPLAAPLAHGLGLELGLMPGRDPAMGSVQAVRRDADEFEAVGDPRSGAVGRVS
jgi:gamma-glutamyltranspeptidase/glutathione hydrolase